MEIFIFNNIFHKIKYIKQIHFSFLPITSLIWIFWVYWLSLAIGFQWLEARSAAKHLPRHEPTSEHRIIWPKCQEHQETLQTTFDTVDQSYHLLHALHKSVLLFSCIFTFLFLSYILLIMLLQLSQFFSFTQLHPAPPTPSGNPHTTVLSPSHS